MSVDIDLKAEAQEYECVDDFIKATLMPKFMPKGIRSTIDTRIDEELGPKAHLAIQTTYTELTQQK